MIQNSPKGYKLPYMRDCLPLPTVFYKTFANAILRKHER